MMDVHDAIARRRAYRALHYCFANQPRRFAFVVDEGLRERMHAALFPGE